MKKITLINGQTLLITNHNKKNIVELNNGEKAEIENLKEFGIELKKIPTKTNIHIVLENDTFKVFNNIFNQLV